MRCIFIYHTSCARGHIVSLMYPRVFYLNKEITTPAEYLSPDYKPVSWRQAV